MSIEEKLRTAGLTLPERIKVPPGVSIPFTWARRYGDRVFVSGHGPLAPDGTIPGPLGKVGEHVSLEQAQEAARSACLSVLSTLKRSLGSLDNIDAWLVVSGLVNVAPGFVRTTDVINPCSEIILQLFGDDVGNHARTAIGVAQLPMDMPVIISAEVAVKECA